VLSDGGRIRDEGLGENEEGFHEIYCAAASPSTVVKTGRDYDGQALSVKGDERAMSE